MCSECIILPYTQLIAFVFLLCMWKVFQHRFLLFLSNCCFFFWLTEYLLNLVLTSSNIFSNSLTDCSRATLPFSGLLPNCLSRIFFLKPLASFILGFSFISSGVHLQVIILFFLLWESFAFTLRCPCVPFCGSPWSFAGAPVMSRGFRKAAREVNVSGSSMSMCIFTHSDGQLYVEARRGHRLSISSEYAYDVSE